MTEPPVTQEEVNEVCDALLGYAGDVESAELIRRLWVELQEARGQLNLATAMVERAGYHNDLLNKCNAELEALRATKGSKA